MKQLCVFGIVKNDKGNKIASEMMNWLLPLYDVMAVYHDGSMFEYPALRKMQEICIKEQRPCLYLHTKGAFNTHTDTNMVRAMWKYEFTERKDLYFELVNRPWATVACPFTCSDKTTWFNGFVANWQAMATLPKIEPNANRKKFERLFRGTDVNVIGVLRSDVERGIPGHITKVCMQTMKQL